MPKGLDDGRFVQDGRLGEPENELIKPLCKLDNFDLLVLDDLGYLSQELRN